MKSKEITNADALSNPGIARCMDLLADLLMSPSQPRWIRDEKTNDLFERQPDNSYKAAYRLTAIT